MAANFNGSGRYFRRTTNLLDYNGTYTIMGWAIHANTSPFYPILFIVQNSAGTQSDSIFGNVETQIAIGTNVGDTYLGVASIFSWRHYALVRESATSLKAYYDGDLLGTNTNSVGTSRTLDYNQIGNRAAGDLPWKGDVGAVKAWTRALTAAEIKNEMRTMMPQQLLSLNGFWPMLKGMRTKGVLLGRDWTEAGGVTDSDGPPVQWGGNIWTPSSANATVDQEGFRFYADDGSESGSTALAAQDTNVTQPLTTPIRLRALINATGDPASAAYKLQFRKVGDATWKDVL